MNNDSLFWQRFRPVRRMAVPGILLLFLLLLAAESAFAWLTRSDPSDTISGAGLDWSMNLTLKSESYTVTTRYRGQDGSWHDITSDYDPEREDWPQQAVWDRLSALLAPGCRTEFETEITSLSSRSQKASVYLSETTLSAGLRNLVRIGTTEPFVRQYTAESPEFSGNEVCTATLLTLLENYELAPGESLRLCWYVGLDAEADGGVFEALCDTEGNALTWQTTDGTGYFAVTKKNGQIALAAFGCDENGELRADPETQELIAYDGSAGPIDELLITEIPFGTVKESMTISGLILAVG